MAADDLTDGELLALDHNDHEAAFRGYLNKSRHSSDKQTFLRAWVKPEAGDLILECGSSSGKTSIDFARHVGCSCTGIDFDQHAVDIANRNRDLHFPELAQSCRFQLGDLTQMQFDRTFNKVLMPDFTEHIPDRVFAKILANVRAQLPATTLFIYTPNRSHIFEILKHRNLLLKNEGGHINVKSSQQLVKFLDNNGWVTVSNTWSYSSSPVVKFFESLLAPIPVVGRLFRRRVAIVARAK